MWLSSLRQCLVLLCCLFGFIQGESLSLAGFDITWTNNGVNTNFKVTSPVLIGATLNTWIGFGFNKNPGMNDASVVMCINSQNGAFAQHNYNSAYASQLIDASNKLLGLSDVAVSVYDSRIVCSFTRDNSNGNSNYFNLLQNPNPYVIVAYGLANPTTGTLMYHTSRAISSTAISFLPPAATTSSTPATTTSTTKTTTPAAPVTTTTIAVTSAPLGSLKSGDFSLVWRKSSVGNALDFTLSYPITQTSNTYIALAFSKDASMGDDDVYACIYAANLKEVARFYNPAGHMPPVKQANYNGVSNTAISLYNGQLTCSFTRPISLAEPNFVDLNLPFYVLLASGSTSDAGSLTRHSVRMVSSGTVRFLPDSETSTTIVTTQRPTSATSSILTTITQTVVPTTTSSSSMTSTPKPNPVVYFSTLIKNFLTRLFGLFSSK